MKNKNELFKALHEPWLRALQECQYQKISVNQQLKCGIISAIDAAAEIDMIKSKERKLKKQLVLAAHVTADGTPRTIKYQESRGLWCALMPGKKRISAATEDALYDKLMSYYDLTIEDFSIGAIFELAMAEKESSGITTFETHRRIRKDFSRYIDKKLEATDIRDINVSKLRSYTGRMLKNQAVNVNAFKNYRTVLNTIFKYALREGIVSSNPVEALGVREYSAACAQSVERSDSMLEQEKILTPGEIELFKEAVEADIADKRYFIYGFCALFSVETGVRAGEIPALRWTDVKESAIHIHSQQLCTRESGKRLYYFVPWTKDEKKKEKKTGRFFPLTDAIMDILERVNHIQEELGIRSDYIFCNRDGTPIHSDNYEKAINHLFKNLGFKVRGNHALRKSLNSNVFIPLGIPVTERARMLGHSVETNLRFYSYAGKDTNDEICALLNQNAQPPQLAETPGILAFMPKNDQKNTSGHTLSHTLRPVLRQNRALANP